MFTPKELKYIAQELDKKILKDGSEIEAYAYNYGIEVKVVNKHYTKITDNETQKVYFEFLIKKNGDIKYPKLKKEDIDRFIEATNISGDIIANL